MGLVSNETNGEFKPYLNAIYACGYEAGKLEVNQHTNKTIGQYDKRGILVNTFKSRVDAARRTGFSESGIKRCMERKTPMKQGWTWKYIKEATTPDSL
jgi:hypothetical protein